MDVTLEVFVTKSHLNHVQTLVGGSPTEIGSTGVREFYNVLYSVLSAMGTPGAWVGFTSYFPNEPMADPLVAVRFLSPEVVKALGDSASHLLSVGELGPLMLALALTDTVKVTRNGH